MHKVRGFVIGLLLCVFVFGGYVLASGPQFFEFLSQEELLKGNLKGVSLTNDGKIVLAPSYELVFNTKQAYLFSMAKDSLGNVYAGSGHEGKVFKIGPNGDGSLFFKTKELDIYAVAVDNQNNVYVGDSPDGKVYKISPDGKSAEFFDPKEKYIWALAFDKDGNLFVATGERGTIYKVDRNGKGGKFFDSQETHIMSLILDHDGNIIAGSSPNGYIYRITPNGKGFVLYDSHLSEIHALTLNPYGDIFAVGLGQVSGGSLETFPSQKPSASAMPLAKSTSEAPTVSVLSIEESKIDSKSLATLAKTSDKDTTKPKSAIYKIWGDNSVEMIWSSKEDFVYGLLVRQDGSVLASTGTKGRILSINSQGGATILVESSEEQVTAMLDKEGRIYAASSNLGKVFLIKPERTREGYYESEVKDTKAVSTWGTINWYVDNPSGKSIELYTRTGNTERPNKTWSDWAGPYKTSEGESIRSPKARYIQWRAVFKGNPKDAGLISQTDVLEKVSIAFLQQNLRPRIASINILPPGIALQKFPVYGPSPYSATTSISASLSTAAAGSLPSSNNAQPKPKLKPAPQPKHQAGARSVVWKAEDENEDELVFQIYFKAEGEHDWKLLEKELMDEFYTIDSNALPDGVYQIKVVASDAPSNPYGKALTSELVSKPFTIDNTPPIIDILSHKLSNGSVEVNFRAKDTTSKILQAEFSVDGGEWRIIFPKDGISDSKSEDYQITIEQLKAGEHTIGLKATDAMGNVGSNKLLVKFPK